MNSTVIKNSRKSCVKIYSIQGQSVGTGFFISDELIATCFHVVAKIEADGTNINWSIFQDLTIVTENGENVSATCISIPNNISSEPLFQDFAILKTIKKVKDIAILPLSKKLTHNITETIMFSGYPLGTPIMVSHVGTISGITKDKSLISVQASTNKGNSGGALINKEGEVIGIISLREGGISAELQSYLKRINDTQSQGSIEIMGINPLQATKETITILDKYISTGIGYARNISFLQNYISKNGIKL
ncbi:S1 family peptidase [Flavobacterium sp. MAHUQ-51]|uniref:S1 family peptidase n=1 Tax=Flavobacterium sp. GCM10022190 TaxID=3252639 RepID=UPI00361B2143